jgi:hypothetical protein
MTISTVTCAIALAFANINKLESFKGVGFEARMPDVIEEANATLLSLQNLARPLLLTNVANITQSGRWHGIGRENEHKLIIKLEELAKSLEISDDVEISDMIKDYYNHQHVDHIRFIASVMDRVKIINSDVREKLDLLTQGRIGYLPPDTAALREALLNLTVDQLGVLEPFVLDYDYYRKHKEFRRPEAVDHFRLSDLVSNQN